MIMQLLKIHIDTPKYIPNLVNLELISTMRSEDQIHRYLGDILRYSSNLIELDNELR